MKTHIVRQISVAIENQPGRLGRIGRLLAEQGIHISAFSVIDNVEQGMVRLITSDPGMTRETLKADGLPVVEADVLSIELLDGMGNLARIGETLAAADINIEYGYATSAEIGRPGLLIMKTANPQAALKILADVSANP
ncbi:MAG: hypothetical protein RLZZ398_1376 [Verrucomicrobiota bacterium]|jgi:hypothetical protein